MTSPITTPNPADQTSNSTPSTGSNQPAPSNTLGPDSFITLLTAQLQAQDPLSPMDPDQMVNELTSINTLQQIVQIRTDMDTLVGAVQPGQSGTGAGSTSSSNISTKGSFMPAAAQKFAQLNSQSQFN